MTGSLFVTCCAALGALPAAAAAAELQGSARAPSALRAQQAGAGGEVRRHSLLVQAPQVEQRMVICNAYASPKALDVTRVSTRQSLATGLAYKQCKEVSLPLVEGEQLDFKAGDLFVGSFYATGIPKSSAFLLLIPHRRSAHSVGVAFESHAFADVQSPQIAVIDAFRGKDGRHAAAVKIAQSLPAASGNAAAPVEEELKFNSVVAVNPGRYDVALVGAGGEHARAQPLTAAGATKHVVMRLGSDDGRYPQELVVFPSRAARAGTLWSAALAMIFASVFGLA